MSIYKILALAILDPSEERKDMEYLLRVEGPEELDNAELTLLGALRERSSPKTIARQHKIVKTPPSTRLV